MVGNDYLSALNINAIMQGLVDVRDLPQELRFLARTQVVPAIDGEIMARFIGRVLIADLVADDAQAATYSHGKFQLERTAAPNLKLGTHLTQAQLNLLNSLIRGNASAADRGIFVDNLTRTMDGLLTGVRQRMEALVIAMHLDGFSYNKLGVIMDNVTWGMPTSLNVVAATAWADAANATPVANVQLILRNARVRYGVSYDRMTLSTAAFNLMIATTEFQNKAKLFLPPQLTFTNLSLLSTENMRMLAQSTLGVKEIELYDARYFYQNPDGSIGTAPFLPLDKVVFTAMNLDNNTASTDFANGVVTESIVSALANSQMVGGFPEGMRGPIGYATVPPDLNPPNVTLWGVARGWPRKHYLQHNAVLDVGTVVDDIPTEGDLF